MSPATSPHPEGAVAIIGMAGRFPGADGVDAFWRNVRNGVDSISRFREDELEDAFPPEVRASAAFVPARPVIARPDLFDAAFFGLYPREAALTDPQHRVLLECAWEALESAGYDPAAYPGAIGITAGCSLNTYFLNNVCADRRTAETFTSTFQLGDYPMLLGAGQDFLTTRIAYKLDLRGPATTLGTACSTSLTAVVQACGQLRAGQADIMLAGGVSISFPQKRGYLHQAGGMASADGRCRPFDAEASGTVFGSGAALVVLKRLDDALRDRDTIHAVIRGGSLNNDGNRKVGFTAPSVDGQVDVLRDAHARAGVDPRTIGYVECHGTATPLGDPIEVAALTRVFADATADRGFCSIGSAKANVGHLDAAAGVTGLIKAALTVRDGVIPPLAHFTAANPLLGLDAGPFTVDTAERAWPDGAAPRRAGVTALGVGGTNAHVVVEQPPALERPEAASGPFVLPLSARTPEALARGAEALAAHLADRPEADLADVAFTLRHGRRAFDHRAAIVCRDRAEAVAALRDPKLATGQVGLLMPPVVFLFPGQGAQYAGMGRDLYATEPTYRDIVDEGARVLAPTLGTDLRDVLCGEPSGDAREAVHATGFAQPALFLTEYATARVWMERGVVPDAIVGHSVGEIVGAALAGVLSFADALAFVAERGRLMGSMPSGAMLAVRLPEADLLGVLPDDLSVAAVNTPRGCVVSGPHEAVARFKGGLDARGVASRPVRTSHAFHSAMMEPVTEALSRLLAATDLSEPALPLVSGVTGTWHEPGQAASGDYWARHCRSCIRFADALTCAVGSDAPVLLEVGPGSTLGRFAAQTLPRGATRGSFASLPDEAEADRGPDAFRAALAGLWRVGLDPAWDDAGSRAGRRVPLPTYQFDRTSHWIAAPPPLRAPADHPAPPVQPSPPSPHGTSDMPAASVVAPPPSPADPAARRDLRARVAGLLQDLSGEPVDEASYATSFLDLGFDSLFLAQLATQVQSAFGVPVTFRQLFDELATVDALAGHLSARVPAEPEPAPAAAPAAAAVTPAVPAPAAAVDPAAASASGPIYDLMRQQIAAMQALFAQQAQVLGAAPPPVGAAAVAVAEARPEARAVPEPAPVPDEPAPAAPSRFQVYQTARAPVGAITPAQRLYIDALAARHNARTAGSKASTQGNRAVLADPRAASGFRADWKELVYPVVCARSKGSRIWDVDGNAYVDLVNGYGQTAFGHSPDFVSAAVAEQLELGFAIGPQSPLAGEVAARVARMTGNARVTFCNTGSEAVMAAMRVARTVTGRGTVVVFEGAYHGQFDEVLVKPASRRSATGALPAAAGIPHSSVSNMVVLPYGTAESLAWIRDNARALAAVVVEPVQSRHPAFLPVAFLRELREVTAASGTALVFDEVVTGFRTHPGGMQAVLGLRADLATYGKVVGGGLPVGILAGTGRFMDALDGGAWRYGDATVPEVAPTFFAGTFVRHPLVLAAVRAVLIHLEREGAVLQERLAARTAGLVGRLNAELDRRGIASRAETYSSWFYFNPGAEDRLAGLLFHEMRSRGVHVQEGFPCFLTTAHDDDDLETVVRVFRESLDALQGAGILAGTAPAAPAAADAPDVLPESVPWTEPQKEVWLTAQLGDAASCSFNESVTLTFEGELDEAALVGALDDAVARHDSLRARFDPTGETMRVAPGAAMPLRRVDLRGADDAARELDVVKDEEARTPFDLAEGPVVRAALVAVRPDLRALVLTAHHIVCDGWSINVLIGEIASLVAARRRAGAADLPAAPSFRRYALEQRAPKAARADTEAFWLRTYATLPPALDLPADRSRPAAKSYRGGTHRDAIDGALVKAVRSAGARHRCTLFVTLLAALQVVVSRLSGETDVVIAIPTAGQSAAGLPGLVGHCVNLLPLRGTVDPAGTLAAQLGATRTALLDAFEHGDMTFGTLVRTLQVPRTPNRLPLTQIQFNLEKLSSGPAIPGAALSTGSNGKAFSNFDLFVNCTEGDDGIRIDCDYNADLFDAATVGRLMAHLRAVLAAIVENDAAAVGAAPLLTPADVRWLADELNDTAAPDLDLRPIHLLVAEQAARTPDATAVAWRDASLTYAELDARANRLAHHLRERVAAPGGRIAVATSRSPATLVAMLGVMKAGHAYVPLDTAQPVARQAVILEDAAVAALVCDGNGADALCPDLPTVDLARDAAALAALPATAPPGVERQAADATAYVIFTSGSTGRPKGVAVPHRALTNLLRSMAVRPGFTSADTLLAVTTIGFDIAGAELLLPLLAGGRVAIADREEVADGFALVDRIASSGATVVQATPSLWRLLLEAGFKSRPGLTMIAGGEVLPRDIANRLLEGGGALWNAYGPTETTIWSSLAEVRTGPDPITIGRPVFNTRLHVLDAELRLAPVGVEGELFIGGTGLASGYFGRDDLTAAAFPPVDVAGTGAERLYRTGDRARRLADGAVQLLGRNDGQIKLRGFRIELEEVEAVLRSCPGVTAAAVALREGAGGDARLLGFLVATVPVSVAAAFASFRLPSYMVPTAWMRLDALPLTANGKLDRRGLPDTAVPEPVPGDAPVLPRTPTQVRIARAICEVLHVPAVGLDDNLFALGLDSLQVFRIAARLRAETIALTAADLMRHPTVLALAEAADAASREGGEATGVPDLRAFRRRRTSISEIA